MAQIRVKFKDVWDSWECSGVNKPDESEFGIKITLLLREDDKPMDFLVEGPMENIKSWLNWYELDEAKEA